MPVYLRKNISFSPPAENIADVNIEDDFGPDPDLLRDKLPQPYRLINKIINNVFENAWTIISKIESKKTADLDKVRQPNYDCAVKVQNFSKAASLADSVDGRYVFIGLPNGITVLDSLTQTTVAIWDEETVDIVDIKCHIIGVQTYLLVTIDELGVAKLFIFASDQIFLLKILNEQESVSNKIIASKCESSSEGDYIGIVLENTAKSESWLEIHRLPRDIWLREMETVVSELVSVAQQQEGDGTDDKTQVNLTVRRASSTNHKIAIPRTIGVRRRSSVSNTLSIVSEKPRKRKKGDSPFRNRNKTRSRSGSPKPGTPPPLLTLTPGEKPSPKFTPPTLVLKIHPPTPIASSNSSSILSACQKVDSGEVIGTGQNHILTAAHLDLRDTVFHHLHEKLMPYLQDDNKKDTVIIQPTFHFVSSSRLTPIGLEQPAQTGRPSTIAVWWTGESQLKQYSLLKTSKDFEHKPELVWPFCNTITSSATSSCETFIAIGLSNGTVVLWDRYIGLEQGVITVDRDCSITRLVFLDQSISSSGVADHPPYQTQNSACLLIQTSTGNQYMYNTTYNTLVTLYAVCEDEGDVQVLLSTMPDVPELLLVVSKAGSLLIKDVTNGNNVCGLSLPVSFDLTSPWEPIYCFGGGGQMLYVKGTCHGKDEEGGITDLSSVFVYQLRSFPSLDNYWKRPCDTRTGIVHPTLEQRVNSLLKYRISQQPLRKERMQQRWDMMKQELDDIQQRQEVSKIYGSRHTFTSSTYRSTPPPL